MASLLGQGQEIPDVLPTYHVVFPSKRIFRRKDTKAARPMRNRKSSQVPELLFPSLLPILFSSLTLNHQSLFPTSVDNQVN